MRRLVPVLQIKDGALVKTVRFKVTHYLGDPLNAIRLFNDLEVDEISIVNLSGALSGEPPDIGFVTELVSEAFMPVMYAGGVRSAVTAVALARCGVEKIGFGTALFRAPDEVRRASEALGAQSTVGMIDYTMTWLGKPKAVYASGARDTSMRVAEAAAHAVQLGCGEVMLTAIDRDGMGNGYDVATLREVASSIPVPLVAMGGAASWTDCRAAFDEGQADAAASGSAFTLEGPRRAVLIKYPAWAQRETLGLV